MQRYFSFFSECKCRYKHLFIIWAVGFLPYCFTASAQNQRIPSNQYTPLYTDIIFSHLTEKDGLSDNKIMDMVLDKDGILWIGTYTGLNRYDGKRFELFFRQNSDTSGLRHNFVSCLALDSTGNIWIGTECGLHVYDKHNHKITYFKDSSGISSVRIHCLAISPEGLVWVGTERGLASFDPGTGKFSHFQHDPKDKGSIPDNRILKNALAYDGHKKGLWLATNKGLGFFDVQTKSCRNYRTERDTVLFSPRPISALHASQTGILWFLDWNRKEIVGCNPRLESIPYRFPLENHINQAYGGKIFETSQREIWYSSNSYETVRLTYEKDVQIQKFMFNHTISTSILGDYVSSMVEDRDKTVWMGTIAGLSRYNPGRQYYKVNQSSSVFPELNGNWQITCLGEDPSTGDQWVCTRDDIVYIYHIQKKSWTSLDLKKFYKDKTEKFIIDIEFIDKQVVFSFVNSVPGVYDPNTGTFQEFFKKNELPEGYKVRVLTLETDSTYLIGNSLPILRWNFLKNTIQKINIYTDENTTQEFTEAGWLYAKKNKGSWLALNNKNIGYIHPGDTLIYPIAIPLEPTHKETGYFNSLTVDNHGDVWFTYSGHGLFRAKKKVAKARFSSDLEWKKWDLHDGLVSEVLLSVQEDKFGRIWCSSFNKFSVYDPAKGEFFNFKIPLSDHNSFYFNYLIPLQNGHILTNIRGDLVTFIPEALKTIRPENTLIISSLIASGKKYFLENTSRITLRPDENFITIGFGSLSPQEDFQFDYEYKLEDIQNSWVKAGKECTATYTDLAPGTYHFKLRMVSRDGLWTSKEKNLTIYIRAPFYNTWWFLTLIFILASFVVGYLVRSRMKSIENMNALRSKAQLLEKEKTTVMYENLKQHLNPHFLFNSLTSLSSLIRLEPKKAIDFLDKMSKVYRYILKNKDNETVPISEELNFVNMYVQLQKTRFEEGFNVINRMTEEEQSRRIVPVTLQNLIENAIKHNTADEESPLIVEIYPEGEYIIVKNNLQRKNFVETSNKQGMQSMVSLYRFLSPLPVIIEDSEEYYIVKIPFL